MLVPRTTAGWSRVALGAVVLFAVAVRIWMGWGQPDPSRFWDERFALENAAVHLEDGRWLPANAFHPTLAHLPQTALLGATRALCRHSSLCDDPVVADGRFTPLAYRLARGLQAIYGGLSLVALFLLGRRLFGDAEGLLAALLLAALPWHIRQSAIAKPDMLLLLLSLVAFLAALRVARRPTLERHAVAGVTIGLAAAAKYNGVTAAFPLLVGTAVGVVVAMRSALGAGDSDGGRVAVRRRLGGLALAGLTSALTFVLLDLHLLYAPWMLRRDFFGRTLRDYAFKGARHDFSGLDQVRHAVETLFTGSFHGPWVAPLALVGLVLVAAWAWRGGPADAPASGATREGWWMLVGFPVLYVATLALTTNNPSAHNWLPLTPYTSLVAAVAAVAAWRWAMERLPARRGSASSRRWWGRMALGATLVLCIVMTMRYAYPVTVPSTITQARGILMADFRQALEDRVVVVDPWEVQRVRLRHSGRKATERVVADLDRPLLDVLRVADGAVLREDRAAAERLEFPDGSRVRRLHPAPFVSWGPPLTVVSRPWRPIGRGRALERIAPRRFRVPPVAPLEVPEEMPGEAPETSPGQMYVSFVVYTDPAQPRAEVTPLRYAGNEVELRWNRTVHDRHRLVSDRVPLASGRGSRQLLFEHAPEAVERVEMRLWLPPRRGSGQGAREP